MAKILQLLLVTAHHGEFPPLLFSSLDVMNFGIVQYLLISLGFHADSNFFVKASEEQNLPKEQQCVDSPQENDKSCSPLESAASMSIFMLIMPRHHKLIFFRHLCL